MRQGAMSLSLSSVIAGRSTVRSAPRTGPQAVPGAPLAGWRPALSAVLGPRPLRVLDVGSGAGDSALLLDELGHFAHGVDTVPETVRRARARASERCAAAEFRVGDAENLEFPARSFDAVHARDLLALLAHPEWALAEWYRVLRPGGLAVVAETRLGGDTPDAVSVLRRAGFHDIETRDVVVQTERPAGGPWYRRLAPLPQRRGTLVWGRRD